MVIVVEQEHDNNYNSNYKSERTMSINRITMIAIVSMVTEMRLTNVGSSSGIRIDNKNDDDGIRSSNNNSGPPKNRYYVGDNNNGESGNSK